jgi:hypothetical protein
LYGAAHLEVYKAFLATKNLKGGIIYDKKMNLRIFAGADLQLPPEWNRNLIFWRG